MTELEVFGISTAVRTGLEKLAHDDGSLVASEVLDAARPLKSPLHDQFTWDNTEAAEQHRIGQARDLIRKYRIRVTYEAASGDVRDLLVRGYVAGRNIEEPGHRPGTYFPVGSLSPRAQAVMLRRMQREINTLRSKYGHLRQFWELISGLNDGEDDGSAAASG